MKVVIQGKLGTKTSLVREVIKEALNVKHMDADVREVQTGVFHSRYFSPVDLLESQKAVTLAHDIDNEFFVAGVDKNSYIVQIQF